MGKGLAKCGHSAKTTGRLAAATHRASPLPAPCCLSPAQTPLALGQSQLLRTQPAGRHLPPRTSPISAAPPAAVLRLWEHLALTHLSPAPSGRRPCHPRGPSREVPSPAPPPPLLGPGKNGGDMGLSSLRTFIQSILTEHSLCPVPRWTPGRPQ